MHIGKGVTGSSCPAFSWLPTSGNSSRRQKNVGFGKTSVMGLALASVEELWTEKWPIVS